MYYATTALCWDWRDYRLNRLWYEGTAFYVLCLYLKQWDYDSNPPSKWKQCVLLDWQKRRASIRTEIYSLHIHRLIPECTTYPAAVGGFSHCFILFKTSNKKVMLSSRGTPSRRNCGSDAIFLILKSLILFHVTFPCHRLQRNNHAYLCLCVSTRQVHNIHLNVTQYKCPSVYAMVAYRSLSSLLPEWCSWSMWHWLWSLCSTQGRAVQYSSLRFAHPSGQKWTGLCLRQVG